MGIRELADKSGIGAGSISRIEQSVNPNPTWEVLTSIALALEVTVGSIESRLMVMRRSAQHKALTAQQPRKRTKSA